MKHDEARLSFYFAVEEIERRRGISRGAAQRTLREWCASGDIRSWKQPYSLVRGEPQEEGPWERIEPSEWKTREVDLTTDADGCNYFVQVSGGCPKDCVSRFL
jgi:hypothetical protein